MAVVADAVTQIPVTIAAAHGAATYRIFSPTSAVSKLPFKPARTRALQRVFLAFTGSS